MGGVGVSRQEGWLGPLTFLGQPPFIHRDIATSKSSMDSVSCTCLWLLSAVCSTAGVE